MGIKKVIIKLFVSIGIVLMFVMNFENMSIRVNAEEIKKIYNIEESSVVITEPGSYKIVGTGIKTINTITIHTEGYVNITIENVNVEAENPFYITKGTVVLYISGNNTLSAVDGSGIYSGENNLTIEGTGKLVATTDSGSGIFAQNIVINSGTIEAYAKEYGTCAIGAANYESVKSITINGGIVKAYANTGLTYGFEQCGNVGIGAVFGDCGDILITGGVIEAYGGHGPGIGGDCYTKSITITGGNIKAYGGDLSAGIGSGGVLFEDEKGVTRSLSKIDNILITGGNITAVASNYGNNWQGVGIGGGRYAEIGTLEIAGGIIKATGAELGAGIGTGMNGICEKLKISGGTINATAGMYSAAIGLGGYDAVVDDIYKDSHIGKFEISGGMITVEAYEYASVGIGADVHNDGDIDEFKITGGTIECNSEYWNDIACEGSEKIIVSGGNIYAERICHPMVSLTEKNLYPHTINVGTKYKGYAVTEIKNKKYGLNDVKVNNKGKVVVYAEKEENVQICVDGKFFGNKSTDKPSKVTSLKQKASYATNAITLTWNKVSGANGYEVYRATSKNGKYTKVASVTKTSYKDSKLKAGKTYYYKVCAYKSVEGTKLCGDYSAIVVAGTQTAKPSLKVVAGKKKATLTWKKVSGADGYELQMSTSKSGNYKKIKTVNSKTVKYTKSKLTKGKKYFFKMRTYRTVGGKKIYSSWSAVKSVKIK